MMEYAHAQHNSQITDDIPSSAHYRHQIGHNEEIVRATFTLFADGGRTTKSNKLQIWPLLGSIAELPPSLRYAQHNCVWFAIWYVFELIFFFD